MAPQVKRHLRAVILALERRGYRVIDIARTQRNHYKLQIQGLGPLIVSATPSDRRALANALADLRRMERNQ